MKKKDCIAMVLAGGKGTRLSSLTSAIPKPVVPFGGNHCLIDFTLSNCFNSHIDTIGVLTPAKPFRLPKLIKRQDASSTIYSLPPMNRLQSSVASEYTGTANAVHANADFIDQFNPEYILILSGDHIYKMDYTELLNYHREKSAVATVAVTTVPWAETYRFGIMTTKTDGAIAEFTEKPTNSQSNLASMGVYIFTWATLKEYLLQDDCNKKSSHDFGKDVIPTMLSQKEKMYAYSFQGYWKDVGTVESLYDAHMDLLREPPALTLADGSWPVFSAMTGDVAQAAILFDKERNSLLHSGSSINGLINGSVIFSNVYIGKNASIKNSVVMPGTVIGEGACVERAIVGPGAYIRDGYSLLGDIDGYSRIAVASENSTIPDVLPYALDSREKVKQTVSKIKSNSTLDFGSPSLMRR
ncbi:Glucose-1-phosphate adenylyltransferase [Sporomusa ovata DSM 2662]|uniref:Glucose-1-phosphate adenylyltransferase n=1 Tax=Sporomusa ovata TaxID=2378 RepID=A0A0U1KXH6_9FIRM|nr:sugar phosphate nucleotidyltransferase [Sporomusa ovata]EQB29597.1 glucose-1-phosphate adenylyltransferase [Sporomusa ovata DSM 2662]CQR72110.1 Glucose-1-phosphate adenylyltransferase [Sporomusa ovata]